MLRNYLVTALRNLERNRLYAAISILGLAVAVAAAVLIAQFVRNEFSYDHWLPGYRQIYKLTDLTELPGQPATSSDITPAPLAGQIRLALAGAAVARLAEANPPLRHASGDSGSNEPGFAWADPDIFKVLPLPALAGDLAAALQQPDTVVITRRVARKYFGRDLPIGEALQVQDTSPAPPGGPPPPWRSMRVTAVLKDLPSNTNLTTEIFASSRSAYSFLAMVDARPGPGPSNYTFVRLPPGQSGAGLQRALSGVGDQGQDAVRRFVPGAKYALHAAPLGEAHLTPLGRTGRSTKPAGSRAVALAITGAGALIVLAAAINFVMLMTARASRRAVEVGVRKAAGARRRDLIVQFVGEALIQVGLAALIGAALAEALIKPFAAFVQRELAVDFIRDPVLLAGLVAAVLVIGFLAAIYPALVLSSFRAASVLKGGPARISGSPIARQGLVMIQFAILVGLILITATLYRQTRYALDRGLGAADSKLIARVFGPSCYSAFPDEVRKLPGVAGAACSSAEALNMPNNRVFAGVSVGGRRMSFDLAPVDFGFFELYGVRPLAGRLFSRSQGEDNVLADPRTKAMPTVVINETAAHDLGFSDARTAVGKALTWSRPGTPTAAPSRIVGVVPDMPVTVRTATDPVLYFVSPFPMVALSIKLTGRDMPATVKAVAATWTRVNGSQPMTQSFLSQVRRSLYLDLITQSVTIAVCAGLAVLIACLGLFALSAFTTERRTQEIGVRKAMGADTGNIVLLLLWQFTIPVLWSIAIALPLGWLAMDHWLRGFIYHVDLPVFAFVLAPLAALAIAWATVSCQSFSVARAKPADALRYE